MSALKALEKTVETLRSPEGCPWDREQTHQSLTRHLIDECSELLDTIDRLDMDHMREELGDVLLQVVLHAQIAREAGYFDLEAVAAEINEKLIRRHPHVFGDEETRERLNTSDKVLVEWEKIKTREKADQGKPQTSLFKDLPPQLPSLLYAYDVLKQIERKGLFLEDQMRERQVAEKAEGLTEKALGRQLLEWTAAARRVGLDPEAALRRETLRLVESLENEDRPRQ